MLYHTNSSTESILDQVYQVKGGGTLCITGDVLYYNLGRLELQMFCITRDEMYYRDILYYKGRDVLLRTFCIIEQGT